MDKAILPPTVPDSLPADRMVGITTTIPLEVVLAAGLAAVDLNNVFVTAREPIALVEEAERAGFPRTCCCWIKGLYGAVHRLGIRRIIGVTQGDCSNTHALMEVLSFEGMECIPFAYPYRPDAAMMARSIRLLADHLGADLSRAEAWRARLAPAREAAARIDRITWQEARISGRENHLWLVSTSDFCGDHDRYAREADRFLRQAATRSPISHGVRLGFVGVPPIVPELYDYVEALGGLVVYNETQRQFAMAEAAGSLVEQYGLYTYPYGIFARVEDIRGQCERRAIDGIIHYVQSFCFRRIEDRILRECVALPVLTVECDLPGPLSGQLKTRLEAFVQMIEAKKRGRSIL